MIVDLQNYYPSFLIIAYDWFLKISASSLMDSNYIEDITHTKMEDGR